MRRQTALEEARPGQAAFWRIAQVGGLVATGALLLGLWLRPQVSLIILWSVLIPLVPASLLVSPAIWRNVCPLASLNVMGNGIISRRRPTRTWTVRAGALGIVLLAILVPARRFLFNTNSVALLGTILAVALAAVILGMIFDQKAGFCNAFCPVLPVERLYGQNPLRATDNARCPPCNMCTRHGCIDLSPRKSMNQVLGRPRISPGWLWTAHGAFAAAFPGFVFGFFTTADGPINTAGTVYVQIGLWAVASFVITALVVRALKLNAARTLPWLAALAVGLYYWSVAPSVVGTLGIPNASAIVLRLSALALVTSWLWRAIRQDNRRRPALGMPA